MKKVLIAVDDTKGARNAFTFWADLCACIRPRSIALLYVEKFEGRSLIDEMLGDAELKTLKSVLRGTDYQTALDRKAKSILGFYKKRLQDRKITGVKTIVKQGHPAEEILKTARQEKADMVILGSRGNRTSRLFMGSVSREVTNNAEVPVLIVK